jgi:peptide-methionine (S)-S-oxide reductase
MSAQSSWGFVIAAGVAAAAVVAGAVTYGVAGRAPVTDSAPEDRPMITSKIAESKSGKVEQATFGAGCFWGVESLFRQTPGVLSTAVGYSGGKTVNPTYDDVCNGDTEHAEVVHVEFDPEQVNFAKLLGIFFDNHNPTTVNRQGPDFGSQYRSVVFYHGDAQQAAAEEAKRKLGESNRWGRPIVTQIVPFTKFYRAEEYHQQYDEKHGRASCHR